MATMSKLGAVVCAAVLWAEMAQGVPSPQQQCDATRITAWKTYTSCLHAVMAKEAKGVTFNTFTAFWKCRHSYFKKWTAFQARASLAGSTCIGARFVDNGDGTVTDNLTELVWEKKTDDSTVHDKDNIYTWSTASNSEDGTAFTSFLGTLNSGGFAGANGWRLPTLSELQTLLLDFPCTGVGSGPSCTCPSQPCIDGALDAANTQSFSYWSATTLIADASVARTVQFNNGFGGNGLGKTFDGLYVRAVRAGL